MEDEPVPRPPWRALTVALVLSPASIADVLLYCRGHLSDTSRPQAYCSFLPSLLSMFPWSLWP